MRRRRLAVLPLVALVAASGLVTAAPAATPAVTGVQHRPRTALLRPTSSRNSRGSTPWRRSSRTIADKKVPATKEGVKKSALEHGLGPREDLHRWEPAGRKAAGQASEQKSVKSGQNPRQIKQAKATQTAKLLTVLVEFNPNANDDFSGVQVPATVFGDRTCVQGGIQNGPLHNQIPNPADAPLPGQQHVLGRRLQPGALRPDAVHVGGDHRARPPGPHRSRRPARASTSPGSRCGTTTSRCPRAPTPSTGAATPWVQVPHSEAWYGADRCTLNDEGEMVAGPPQRQVGHPDNPQRTRTARHRRRQRPDDAASRLPAPRLRHRGSVRPRRRRQPVRTGRLHRPRRARPRRRGQVRRRRLPRRRTPSGRTPARSSAAYHIPGHRPSAVQLHRPARGLRRGRVLARVRPRPRASGPLRHERRRRLAHRVLGPHELRLAQWALVPVDAHPHGHLGQVDPRLGRPAHPRSRRRRSRRPRSARRRARPGHRGRRAGQPARQDDHPRHSSQRHLDVVEQQRSGLGRRAPRPHRRRAGRAPTPGSGCGTTTPSRRTGTSASSRSPPTVAPRGRAEGLRRGRRRGHHPRRL